MKNSYPELYQRNLSCLSNIYKGIQTIKRGKREKGEVK